jgi:uncharacterized Zn-finger protein
VHSGQLSCYCLVCKKSFSNKIHLKMHQHVHTEERP